MKLVVQVHFTCKINFMKIVLYRTYLGRRKLLLQRSEFALSLILQAQPLSYCFGPSHTNTLVSGTDTNVGDEEEECGRRRRTYTITYLIDQVRKRLAVLSPIRNEKN